MNEIERLQEYLLLIRRAAGWTAEDFGERIGVTRQTINNLEAKRNKLNKTQYIAMRAVLDAEIADSPEDTEMLRCLLDVFIDNPEKYDKKDRETLLSKANMLTPSILAGTTTRKEVSKELVGAAGALGLAAALASVPVSGSGLAIAGGTSAWLLKTIKGKK
jgi:transcriptional regulator with XRE-family HTH domain